MTVPAPPSRSVDASHSLYDLIEQLTERLNRKEPVDLEAVAAEHPQHADELRKVWPSLAILADLRSADGRSALSFPPGNGAAGAAPTGELGDYRIVREIGRGGMGIVYDAEQISLGRRVALKVLPFAGVLDERQLKRFKNEALAAAQLSHPHIVDVYGVGCERGVHYYTMRLIDGESLQQLIGELRQHDDAHRKTVTDPAHEPDVPVREIPAKRDVPARDTPPVPSLALRANVASATAETPALAALSTDPARRREYFRQIAQLGIDAAEALHHAHEQGVVHRDVKPSNLMLDGRGKVWVTDFGLAQIETGATLTMSGELIGTLRYMSPEQATGQRLGVDHRTDVYSLGSTLYELLTLQPAFDGETRSELLQQILFQEPRPPRKVRPEVPVDLQTIVLKAMGKVAAERYASAEELAEDLQRFLDAKSIQARPARDWERIWRWARRNRAVASLIALLFLSLLGGTAVSTVFAVQARRHLADVAATQTRLQREHDLAQENLSNAAETVQRLLTRVSQDMLFSVPGATKLRRQLLIEATEQLDTLSRKQADPQLILRTAAAYRAIGVIHFHTANFADAEAALSHAISLLESMPLTVDKQESVFEELVAAHATLGEVHWYEGRLVAAESQLTRALVINAAIDSRDDDALHVLADREALIRLRGLVYMSLGRSADARIAFELALRLSSDLARQSLGVEDRDQGSRIPLVRNQIYLAVFFEQGDGSAIRSLDNAITLIHEIEARLESADLTVMSTAHPSASWNPIPARQQLQWIEAEALLWKGRMLQASGDKPGAHNCFVESVSLLEPIARDFPDIFWTRTQLAASYGYLGTTVDRAEADKHFATAATLAEGIPDVKRVRGHVFNIVAWCMVSECLADRDYHLAVQYAHVAVECMPECRTYNTLGVALYRSGRFEEAITALNESYRRETVKGGYNAFFLAMAEWRLGNVHVAHKWFDDASSSVERSPTMVKWDLSRFRKEAAELLGIPPLAPTATLQ